MFVILTLDAADAQVYSVGSSVNLGGWDSGLGIKIKVNSE